MHGFGREWENGSRIMVGLYAYTTQRHQAHQADLCRHHHNGDRHILVRADQRCPSESCDIRRADPLGSDRVVGGSVSRCCSCSYRST